MSDSISSELEEVRGEFEKKIDEIKNKLYDAEMSSGYMYIRHLVFMNGGALVAILSTKAALMSQNVKSVDWTFGPMVFFTIGLILTVILNGMLYLRACKRTEQVDSLSDRFEKIFDSSVGDIDRLLGEFDSSSEDVESLSENVSNVMEAHIKKENFYEDVDRFSKQDSRWNRTHICIGIAGLVFFILGAFSGINKLY